MDQYHLGEIAEKALSELEKVEATAEKLMAENATLRRERDEARFQVQVLTRTLDQMQKTVAAFVAAARNPSEKNADMWGYRKPASMDNQQG